MYSGIFSTQIGIGLKSKRKKESIGEPVLLQSNGKIRQKFPDRFFVAQSYM